MCLIITGTARKVRSTLLNTTGLLDDIFTHNSDGVGAMYATAKHGLRVVKDLPENYIKCRNFIARLPHDERNLAIHFRMRTHGDVDLENCHPYEVIPGLAMMHNGVLAHGNKADPTKSDTWHYIHNYLAPLFVEYPDLMTNLYFRTIVENDIGSNRFVFLDESGEMEIYNEEQGIEHDDLWFSNTYAWSPEMLIPGYRKPSAIYLGSGYGGYRGGSIYDPDDWQGYTYGASKRSDPVLGAQAGPPVESEAEEIADTALATEEDDGYDVDAWAQDLWACVGTWDSDGVLSLLESDPVLTLGLLFAECSFEPHAVYASGESIGPGERMALRYLVDENQAGLVRMARSGSTGAATVADAICFFGAWRGKPSEDHLPPQEIVPRPVAVATH